MDHIIDNYVLLLSWALVDMIKYYKILFNVAFSTFDHGKRHGFKYNAIYIIRNNVHVKWNILSYIKYEQMNHIA